MSALALVGFVSDEGRATNPSDPYAVNYFLDNAPSEEALSKLAPKKEVVVAKVKVTNVYWRGGRHGEGRRNTRLGAKVKIIEVMKGSVPTGEAMIVAFGGRDPVQRDVFPRTPSMQERNYFIAFNVDEHNENRLIGFPVEKTLYEQWNREWLQYEMKRNKAGARDY